MNCHRKDRFLSDIKETKDTLKKDGVELLSKNIFVSYKDNQGNFPSAYISKRENDEGVIELDLFKNVQHPDCQLLYETLHILETEFASDRF